MGRVSLAGRVLAVVGASLVVYAVSSRTAWWSFHGGSELFSDMAGTLGPYVGKWCSEVFCHDYDMTRLGSSFSWLGAVTFYAGLVCAAASALTALARRERIVVFSRAAAGASIVTFAVALATVISRHGPRAAQAELGAGLYILGAGVACVIGGCLLAARAPAGPPIRARPLAGRVALVTGCVLGIAVISTNTFWHWKWSDEVNDVGLDSTRRCWVHPDRTICSTVESVDEIFMNDKEHLSRFARQARYTFDATIAAAVLSLVSLFVKRRQLRELGHVPWLVVLASTAATLALTPDVGTARDIHAGYGFVLLALACLAAISGHVLATPPASGDAGR
jgi:hypothetical protein